MEKPVVRTLTVEKISSKDLPLFCPPNDTPLWNMHPRVYLPFDQNKRATCPYCSAVYQLTGEQIEHH